MKKVLLLSIILILTLGLILGCTPARRVDPDNNNNRDMVEDRNTVPNNQDPNNQIDRTVPKNNDLAKDNNNIPGDDTARARRVADIAADVKGVKNATVVVTGEMAYVGIDMDANMQGEETNRLKEKVGDRIKEREKTIDRVMVSADSDTVTRLREIGKDIGSGRPVSGFLEELTEMFRRPTPNVQ